MPECNIYKMRRRFDCWFHNLLLCFSESSQSYCISVASLSWNNHTCLTYLLGLLWVPKDNVCKHFQWIWEFIDSLIFLFSYGTLDVYLSSFKRAFDCMSYWMNSHQSQRKPVTVTFWLTSPKEWIPWAYFSK